MMELFSPAATVLTLSFVISYHSSLTGGDGAIEPPLNNTVKIVRWTETFQKRDETKPQLCGRTKVGISPLSRGKNIFKDNGDDLYDDVDYDEHLDRMMGGSYAVYGEIPWHAGVYYDDYYICSAAIISEFWVISASHCFGHQENHYRISVGDHRLWHQDLHEVTFQVNRFFSHEEFGKKGFDNDIALIKIKPTSDGRGIRFNDYVQPICLPYSIEDPPVGAEVTVSGWGYTGTDKEVSIILKKAKLVINHSDVCERAFYNLVNSETLCVSSLNRDSELCPGDSGGPATFLNKAFAVLIGVNAYSGACGVPAQPSGLSNVPLHRRWIYATIRLHSDPSEMVLPARGFVSG